MTDKQKTYKAKIGLYVQEQKENSGYYRVIGYPVIIGPNIWEQQYRAQCIDQGRDIDSYKDIHDQTIRNASDRHDHPSLYLENLRADSLGSNDDRPRTLFAWETRYHDVYSIDATKAERMASTLKTIYRKYGKLSATFGEPTTYGQYLARFAQAISADTFVFNASPHAASRYSDNEHDLTDIRQGIYRTDRMIQKWMDAGQPARSTADV